MTVDVPSLTRCVCVYVCYIRYINKYIYAIYMYCVCIYIYMISGKRSSYAFE